MKKFGLIGHPLGHSLSPQIHARLFELDGVTADYRLYDITPEDLKGSFDFLKTLDGFNITIPHKIAAIELCNSLDDIAKRYMTINCVNNDGGKFVGYNTDVVGFTKSIETLGASLGSDVLLLGCGGVGRMIAFETAYSGGRLTIAVRESGLATAETVKADIEKNVKNAFVTLTTLDNISGKYDLLVNATPVGMFPKTDAMPVGEDVLGGVDCVFDVIYNPRETLLIKEAKKHGVKTLGGMAMLVLQAAAAHEIWSGASYRAEDLRTIIAEMEALL